jgi:hypothetical protein
MPRWLLNLWVYVLPIPMFLLLGWAWMERTGSLLFVAYVLAVPTIYGYAMPFYATRVLRLWRFHGKMVWGTIYVHHGFKYAASLNLFMYIAWLAIPFHGRPRLAQYLAAVFCTAFGYAFVTWIHDTELVKRGMAKLNNPPARAGMGPEAVVYRYAPLSFFLIGLCFAAGGAVAFHLFVVEHAKGAVWFLGALGGGLALLFTVPAFAYAWVNRED